ncbi:MAG: valine--pyruvate transaminase [Cellvibrionaceae bacterium]
MSHFAKRFTGLSGIVSLMEDLGDALNQNPEMIFMGGGNPAQIDKVEACIAQHLQAIAQNPNRLHKLVGEYQPPQGDPSFLSMMADFLSEQYGWSVSANNIAISNGGQSAFFTLFNMLAGEDKEKENKHIVLPMVPDYLGYADAGLDAGMFKGYRPNIIDIDDTFFKYAVNFSDIELNDNAAAVCFSRPTNPSGNLITDDEVNQLKKLCRQRKIPMMIDAAYGKPFPGVTFVDHSMDWDDDTILILSLSKLGLPGVRTGIVIAHEDIITRFSRATASLSLAPSNLGPTLCKSLIQTNDLMTLSLETIKPYYLQKMQQTVNYLADAVRGLPVKIHKPEGAFFLWLWFQDLPISSQQLYERLKEKGVLVLSGHHFFQPLGNDLWPHQHQCIRLSYCQPWERVKQGIDILMDEIEVLYDVKTHSFS